MIHTERLEPCEDLCSHDFAIVNYNTEIDFDPESPLSRVPGPWMLLRCRVCQEETVRPYHPGYRVTQDVIPYLLTDTTHYSHAERAHIDRFIQAHPTLIRTIIQHEAERAMARYHLYLTRAQLTHEYARRLQAWLAK
jgi:hypothetical protein